MIEEPIVKVEGLWFTYEEDVRKKKDGELKDYPSSYSGWILRDLDLEINRGDFVAIIGQNGAGKTTLVKHFNGLNKAIKGVVKVNQRDVNDIPFKEIAEQIGYVYQNPDHQIFNLTVDEEISFGLKQMGLPEEEIKERVKQVREIVGLRDLEDEYPFALGRGQRQKLAVASILAMDPPILIIDEPTTGLDWRGGLAMMNLIKDLHDRGHTIIMITHDMRIVSMFSERVVIMAQGKVLFDGETRDAFVQYDTLKEAFLQPPQINRISKGLSDALDFPKNILKIDEAVDAYQKLMQRGAK